MPDQLYNLSGLKKTLSELSEEELRNLMLQTRTNRRVVKPKTLERAKKAEASGMITKANISSAMNNLSAEQLDLILQKITGG